ncbi:MAG: pentapeptide repeat-containing protein, partial [Cyanobacteria bacterium J06628_6]
MPTSNNRLLQLYKQGQRDFHGWNLSGCDLSQLALSEIDLSYANLSFTNLSGTDLHRLAWVRLAPRSSDQW